LLDRSRTNVSGADEAAQQRIAHLQQQMDMSNAAFRGAVISLTQTAADH
jgi:hypothetical protein